MTYSGEERRSTSMFSKDDKELILKALTRNPDNERKFFGFKLQEIVIIATILFGILAFYWRTDDSMKRLIKLTDYLISFAANSDNYHSSVIGVPFDQGRPTNGYKVQEVRQALNIPNGKAQ